MWADEFVVNWSVPIEHMRIAIKAARFTANRSLALSIADGKATNSKNLAILCFVQLFLAIPSLR